MWGVLVGLLGVVGARFEGVFSLTRKFGYPPPLSFGPQIIFLMMERLYFMLDLMVGADIPAFHNVFFALVPNPMTKWLVD